MAMRMMVLMGNDMAMGTLSVSAEKGVVFFGVPHNQGDLGEDEALEAISTLKRLLDEGKVPYRELKRKSPRGNGAKVTDCLRILTRAE